MKSAPKDSSRASQAKNKEKGSALISVLMMSLVLFAFIIAISILVNQRFHSINLKQSQNRARYAAQAGLTRALEELGTNPSWDLGFQKTVLAGDQNLHYIVDVTNNYLGNLGDPGVYAPDGVTWIPSGTIWVRSVGLSGDVSQGASGLVGVMGQFRPSFDYAVFGDQNVRIIGVSRILSADGTGRADVGSNGLSGPAITISNNSTVEGRAVCGPSADPQDNNVISIVNSQVTGGREAANESKVLIPLRDDPSVLSENNPSPPNDLAIEPGFSYHLWPSRYGNFNPIQGDLILSADPVTHQGVFFLDGDLTIAGGRIVVEHADPDNPTVVYVAGNANFQAGSQIGVDTAGNPIDPRALQIYFTEPLGPPGAASSLTATGITGNFVAAGDNLNITVAQSTVAGAFIGRSVVINDSTVTYQDALNNLPLQGQGDVTILSTDPLSPVVAQQIANGTVPPPEPPQNPNPPPINPPPNVRPAQPGVATAANGGTGTFTATVNPGEAAAQANPAPPAAPPATTNPAAPPVNSASLAITGTNAVPGVSNNLMNPAANPAVTNPAVANPAVANPTTSSIAPTVGSPSAGPITTGIAPSLASPTAVNGIPAPANPAPANPAPASPPANPAITTTGPNGSGGTVLAPAPPVAPITIGPINIGPLNPILPSIQLGG